MPRVRPQRHVGLQCWRCSTQVASCPACGAPLRGRTQYLREMADRYPSLASSHLYISDLDGALLTAWRYRRTPVVLSLHEAKQLGTLPDRGQIEVLAVLDTLLAAGSRSLAAVPTLRGTRPVRYVGAYVHTFHGRPVPGGRVVGGHDSTDSAAVSVYRVGGIDRLEPVRTYRLTEEEAAYAAFLAAGGAEPPIPGAVEIRRAEGGVITVQLTLDLMREAA